MPDSLEKLYAIADNLIDLLCENLSSDMACDPDDLPLGNDALLLQFKYELWWMRILCNEGWRLFGDYEQPLAFAAGHAMEVCGVAGTSGHEVALRLVDDALCKIMRDLPAHLLLSRRGHAHHWNLLKSIWVA